eukprot:2125112-Ditylum_brightwellii.AAC.1
MPKGAVEIAVTTNGIDFTDETVTFISSSPFYITSIFPTRGTVRGGTRVLIEAPNVILTDTIGCRFGDHHVPATYSNSRLMCRSPEVVNEGQVVLSITLNGQDYYSSPESPTVFTYLPIPEVLELTPTSGWVAGGTKVTLVTKNAYFDVSGKEKVFCSFGSSKLVSASPIGKHLVNCVAPKMRQNSDRTVAVSLVYDSTDTRVTGGALYTYVEPIIVNGLDPSVGSMLGGTVVSVYGLNFRSTADLQCYFGNRTVPALFKNEHTVTCTSPKKITSENVVVVKVAPMSGSMQTYYTSAYFEYVSHPYIYSIIPQTGSIQGGTLVTLKGHGFSKKYAHKLLCRFGKMLTVAAEYKSNQEVRCISPNAEGIISVGESVQLAISINGHDFVSSKEIAFTFIPQIYIKSLNPSSAPVTGGT